MFEDLVFVATGSWVEVYMYDSAEDCQLLHEYGETGVLVGMRDVTGDLILVYGETEDLHVACDGTGDLHVMCDGTAD